MGRWFFGEPGLRFDQRLGLSGGSDSELFSRMQRAGARFVACREAQVWEDVPADRATLRWLWSRFYRNGLIYERIARQSSQGGGSGRRLVSRLLAAGLLMALGLPWLMLGRPERFVRGTLRVPLAMGGLRQWRQPQAVGRHVHYQARPGETAATSTGSARSGSAAGPSAPMPLSTPSAGQGATP
jgi:hypothetical protein